MLYQSQTGKVHEYVHFTVKIDKPAFFMVYPLHLCIPDFNTNMINKKGKAKHCVAILHEKEMIFRAKIKYVKTTSCNNLKRIYLSLSLRMIVNQL